MEIKEQIIDLVNNALGLSLDSDLLTEPPNVAMGEFALPCFELAKKHKTSPVELATQFAKVLQSEDNDLWQEVKAAGPYVNFYLQPKFWNHYVLTYKRKAPKNNYKTKTLIEYSQPNTHKIYHVGHLRTACLGASLVNIFRYSGYNVVSATYVNNIGAHVAKCLWNYINHHASDELPVNKGKFLGEIYAEATERIGENEELKAEVAELLQKLESKDPDIMKVWQETHDWSIDEFKQIYDQLNIKFDQWYFENEIVDNGKEIVKTLLEKGIAKKSEGAVIVDLEKYNLDVLVILKSDGNTLYSTSDLALAYEKSSLGADQSLYVVDNRQTLYFKQLFKTLELAGFHEELTHVPYELVTLPDGSMSSRKGNIISYEDFVESMQDKLVSETKKRHQDWSEEEIQQTSFKVNMAAIKFGMLKHENNRVITFDMDAAMAVEGATGPYLLYAASRVHSILEKIKIKVNPKKVDFELLDSLEERDLIKHLSRFDEIVANCVKYYQPSYLCTYLLELAQKFNTFYHQHSVVKSDKEMQQARVVLLGKVQEILEKGLELLNIESVEEM